MRRMAILSLFALACLALGLAVSAQSPAPAPHILEFNTMFPVSGPYVGEANPIRGVNGGGIPWLISGARGVLGSDGRIVVIVKGLVLATTHANPIANFRTVVSCQSIDGSGNPSVVNVSTREFPASSAGDSVITDTVELPNPCIAPIVFVTSPMMRWFAVTGH